MRDINHHLLISDRGLGCVCIIEAPRGSKFTPEQKEKLMELYGNYIVTSLHHLEIDCFERLDVISNLDEYLEL